MIVRLTNRQSNRVRALAVAALTHARHQEHLDMWWGRDKTTASKHRVDIVMPAVGWRTAESAMFDHCFDERGFRAKERVRTTDLNALKAIRQSMNARENHPALSGRGAIGLIPELIPAWKIVPDQSGKMYSPYPTSLGEYVVLAPFTTTVQTKQVTAWVEAGPGVLERGLPILDEEQHWLFVQ